MPYSTLIIVYVILMILSKKFIFINDLTQITGITKIECDFWACIFITNRDFLFFFG